MKYTVHLDSNDKKLLYFNVPKSGVTPTVCHSGTLRPPSARRPEVEDAQKKLLHFKK